MINQIGFVGFGLIGGSLAKSFKKYNLVKSIIAYDIDSAALSIALKEGVIDYQCKSISDRFDSCDLVFLCCPVQINIKMFQELSKIIQPNCIITDVGSTKLDIHEAFEAINKKVKFIGGHPMTGSEKSGYQASSAQLFENIFYVFTPSTETRQEDLDILVKLVTSIDSLPLIMDAKVHDQTTASISHIPHVIAALIVNSVKALDTDKGYMHTLAAGGFKDITRIASASPIMWQQICLSNKEPILSALGHFKSMLSDVEDQIHNNDSTALFDLFEEAKTYRDTFNTKTPGILSRSYSLSVDVDDEPGIIAKIATLLSDGNINIKNIGIINNREIDHGVLNIVFEDQIHMDRSITLLTNLGYTIYT